MSVTKQLNSKSNIKQYSDADLPFNPKQPVIAKMTPQESTLNQTVINLGFQVDTVNNQDALFVAVDGKILTIGSTFDYVMSGVDQAGYSSQVTLNAPLIAGLNIQAWKLGVKKESEFAQDQRFTNLYESIDAGSQSFIRTNNTMAATTTTGTPAAGSFYSSVVNRSAMPDLSQDIKPRYGIERMELQQLNLLPGEFGASNEAVWSVANDLFNQIRFIGPWSNFVNTNGQGAFVPQNGYMEVTFYGTGLNILLTPDSLFSGANLAYAVDGGSNNTMTITGGANPLNTRNYSANLVFPVVSGLTAGVHTVKLLNQSGSVNLAVTGLEFINTTSLVVQPGVTYNQGKKQSLSLASSSTYNSVATGTRGGRVLVYQKSDGTIGQGWQATNASQANLTSADHTNEDIARTYYFREFGAARSDDFSTNGNNVNRAFTLDDGTTALQGTSIDVGIFSSKDALRLGTLNGYVNITFVGTGLDVIRYDENVAADTITVFVNGTSVGTLSTTGVLQDRVQKIVSGLPYGTHTVRLVLTASGTARSYFSKFITYKPKKPALPSGAVELSDYCVMADYSGTTITGTTSADNFQMPVGTLTKLASRELVYGPGGGGWTYNTLGSANPLGTTVSTGTNGDYLECRFWGTGFVAHFGDSSGGTFSFTATIDGALNATGVARSNASNGGGGTYSSTTSTGGLPVRVEFTGLAAGFHTVRLTKTAGPCNFIALHIIAPAYAGSLVAPFMRQNSLNVGNSSIGDSRRLYPSDQAPQMKVRQVARQLTTNITTSSTSYVPLPEMSLTVRSNGAWFEVRGDSQIRNDGTSGTFVGVHVNGVLVEEQWNSSQTGSDSDLGISALVYLPAGVHKIDLFWKVVSSTARAWARILIVKEL